MTSTSCPTCGKPLPPGRDECPSCLFAQGFATGTGGSSTASLPDLPEIQARFPQFEILECLGRGGMGVVYKARQKSLNRLVALKVLAPEREHDTHFSARFSREAEILARLNHPHIVTIHDFGESDGLFYLVMEFVDGVNLRDLLRDGRVEPRQALAIVPEICDALQFAHDQGVVHRDIKPENILLDRNGRVKVADFGIAKLAGLEASAGSAEIPADAHLTAAGNVLGTPAYMAPEQMTEPDKVDHRADIYALGAVFYQMLTGETPPEAAPPPSRKVAIDVRLDEIVLRALEKDPERRYQRVSEVRTKLDTLNTPPPLQKIPGAVDRAFSPPNRIKSYVILVVTSALVSASVVIGLRLAKSSRPKTVQAEYAWKLWNEQRFSEAKDAFETALTADPADASAWNGLGWSLFNSGHPAEAVTAFEKAVKLNPQMPGALNGIGQIALMNGDFKKAEEHLLRAAPQAPAAWYGLTRIYLLEGKFDRALPWAQKIVDSGEGGDLAKQLLQAARSGYLDDKLRRKISPVPPNPSAAKEPPKLQALAWLDEPAKTWNQEGQRFSLADSGLSLSLLTPPTVTDRSAKDARFLCLWFSQPVVDNLSMVKVELLGSDNRPLPAPSTDFATGASRPTFEHGKLGWLTATVCAGSTTSTPDKVSIRLHYSSGPWQFWDDLAPDFRGHRALAIGVQASSPFESTSGLASVQITRDKSADNGVEQWDFVAYTRDARRLERNSTVKTADGNQVMETFSFDVPLRQVARFEIRKRPISTSSWTNVPLLSENRPAELILHADGSVTCSGATWTGEETRQKLLEWGRSTPGRAIVLKAAKDCPYARVTEILDQCAKAGLTQIGFVTERAPR